MKFISLGYIWLFYCVDMYCPGYILNCSSNKHYYLWYISIAILVKKLIAPEYFYYPILLNKILMLLSLMHNFWRAKLVRFSCSGICPFMFKPSTWCGWSYFPKFNGFILLMVDDVVIQQQCSIFIWATLSAPWLKKLSNFSKVLMGSSVCTCAL